VNVKKQAGVKVADTKARITEAASHAIQSAPPPFQQALDTAATKARPLAQQAAPYRKEIIAGVGAALLVLLVLRRRVRS